MTNYTDKKDKETRENNEISDFLKHVFTCITLRIVLLGEHMEQQFSIDV